MKVRGKQRAIPFSIGNRLEKSKSGPRDPLWPKSSRIRAFCGILWETMAEKKRQVQSTPIPELSTSVTEILVANGRSFQPFIRTFSYTGENVTKAGLGTLVGVFEIDDQTEDSAYIVNFLASVAKKEYFSNPRRGAIESFEAALHKINLALAELVKHGNVTWLGKLHGALGVLEKNNLHFSVTGQAKILLLRGENLADISDGLASDESSVHPIKTFVEVSSGRLMADDQALLTSPELLALFSLEELTRHAVRMDRERFTQFLKTALVNELDMAGLIITDVHEATTLPTPAPTEQPTSVAKAAPVRVNNVFSQSAFTAKKPSEVPSVEDVLIEQHIEKEEYIDNKTGHIYVQGDTPEIKDQHPFIETLGEWGEESLRSIRIGIANQGKNLRKGRKQLALGFHSLLESGEVLTRRTGRVLRRQWRRLEEARAKRAEEQALKNRRAEEERVSEASVATPVEIPIAPTVTDIPRPTAIERVEEEKPEDTPEPQTETTEMPDFLKERLASFYRRGETTEPEGSPAVTEPTSPRFRPEISLPEIAWRSHFQSFHTRVTSMGRGFRQSASSVTGRIPMRHLLMTLRRVGVRSYTVTLTQVQTVSSRFQGLTRPYKLGILGIVTLVLLGGGYLVFRPTPTVEPAPTPVVATPPSTAPTPPGETNQNMGELTVALSGLGGMVTSLLLNDELYVVLPTSIRSSEGETFPLPAGARAQFATAMNDLRLIFIATDRGTLYAFSPITKKFIENTLPLESSASLRSIGSYLTYLYVLDNTTDQIYRFPRAEGGFGAGTPWLKETVAIDENTRLSVNETLYLVENPTTIRGFFRGRASNTFESPKSGMEIVSLYTFPGLTNVYGLDASHHRILIWNQDGRLIRELSHEKFSDGRTLSVNEKNGELFIGTEDALLSFKLK